MKKLIAIFILLSTSYIIYDTSVMYNKQTEAHVIDSITQGELILINRQYAFQSDATDLVNLQKIIPNYIEITGDYLLNTRAAESLTALFKQAKKDGVQNFKINSAYRDFHLQQKIYEETGDKYALPAGYSEHQTGLALDIGSTQGIMSTSAEGIWLANYAHEFGFILRYPENKTSITGIEFEPWHFRYVGLPHSAIMKEHEFVLEEYLSYIQATKELTYTVNDVTYTVIYVTENSYNDIPSKNLINISGNNLDGYIATYKK